MLDERGGHLLFVEGGDALANAVVSQDLSNEETTTEVSLEASDVIRESEWFLARWGDRTS